MSNVASRFKSKADGTVVAVFAFRDEGDSWYVWPFDGAGHLVLSKNDWEREV